jgi:lysophospholipase L1-like esterase
MHRIQFKPYIYIALLIFIFLNFYNIFSRVYYWRTGKVLARTAVPYSRLMSTSSTERVLMIGDSTVVGTGASSPLKSIAGRFGTECKNWEIVNMGKNGDRTIRLANRISIGKIGKFDLIIIQIGGNDVVYATPLDQIKEDIDLILEKMKVSARHVMLVSTSDVELTPFFPWYIKDIYSEKSEKINQIFSEAASRHGVLFVSTPSELASSLDDNNKYWAGDRFHPNDNGYQVWFDLIKRRLEQAGILEMNFHGVDGMCIIN